MRSKSSSKYKPFLNSLAMGFISLVSALSYGNSHDSGYSASRTQMGAFDNQENLGSTNEGKDEGQIDRLSDSASSSNSESHTLASNFDDSFVELVSSNTVGGNSISLQDAGYLLKEIDDIFLFDIPSINNVLVESAGARRISGVVETTETAGVRDSDDLADISEEVPSEPVSNVDEGSASENDPPTEGVLSNGSDVDEILNGSEGSDELYGFGGDDELNGHAGDDVLSGGAGDDVLTGGAGDDVLLGGAGSDVLTGGGDSDVFVFSDNGGVDLITDFVSGDDSIDLSGISMLDGFASLQTYFNDPGLYVVLDFGNHDQLTILDISAIDLTEEDFIF